MKQSKARPKRRDVGSEYLDPEKLQFHRRRNGWTISRVTEKSGLTRNTVYAAFRGDGIRPYSAKALADCFEVPVESLRISRRENDGFEPIYSPPCLPEWEIEDGSWSRWQEASNRLQYRVCKLRHRFIKEDFGRGKFYDLLGLPKTERDEFTEHLTRHSQVCRMIKHEIQHQKESRFSQIAENRNTSPISGGDAWWVVDEWIDGKTLETQFAGGILGPDELQNMVLQLGNGIAAVHRANIIVRELAPIRILVGDNGRFIVTELELAKLAGNYPTVSADWPDDPYRAPEVEGGNVTRQADLYSLGRIFIQAAAGELPEPGFDVPCLALINLPKSVFAIIRDCLSLIPENRPRDVTQVIKVFNNWKTRGSK